MNGTAFNPSDAWQLDRPSLRSHQLQRLNAILAAAVKLPFYRGHLGDVSLPLNSLDELSRLPLLTKQQMLADEVGRPARIFGLPRQQYRHFHQTSGTSGRPMPVLDTQSDWQWWLDCWAHVLAAANITENDIAMMAFSFGPFIGFWTASDALHRRGALVIPGGGLSSEARLQLIVDHGCTVVCCTPTYALHLLEVAERVGIDLASSRVRRLIVAGEPGGSLPSIRQRMERGWNASVTDHSGGSEIGAWGFGSEDGSGIHIIETEFIAECLVFDQDYPDGRAAESGEPAELILTGLGRFGGPAIRYRTGDIVRADDDHDRPCKFLFLDGGVIGRADDMIVVRGVNIFPSSVESIVREVDAVAEFRMIVQRSGVMDSLVVDAELTPTQCQRLASLFQSRLAMRIPVRGVPANSLPRFSAKAKRLVRREEG
ncbi:MAG: phenylacetate--CoA ligase family protein [Planctomycetota bacterium]